jgi:hypothetical protein
MLRWGGGGGNMPKKTAQNNVGRKLVYRYVNIFKNRRVLQTCIEDQSLDDPNNNCTTWINKNAFHKNINYIHIKIKSSLKIFLWKTPETKSLLIRCESFLI